MIDLITHVFRKTHVVMNTHIKLFDYEKEKVNLLAIILMIMIYG